MQKHKYFLLLCLWLMTPMESNADWSVSVTNDPMTDDRKGFATIIGSAKITARCFASGSVDVVVGWNKFLTNRNSHPLNVRVGNEKMLSFSTSISTDGTSQFVKNTGALIAELMKEDVIKLQTKNYEGTSTNVVVLDTAGFKKSWKEACGWHYKYDSEKGYIYRKNPNRARNSAAKNQLEKPNQEISNKQNRIDSRQIEQLNKRYILAIRQSIMRNYRPPPGVPIDAKCDASITQTKNGDIVNFTVKQCSGSSAHRALSQSLERAISASSPLPAPPRPEIFDRLIQIEFPLGQ